MKNFVFARELPFSPLPWSPTMAQISTLTLFKLKNASSKYWAFKMMQVGHASLADVKGQTFYKLMGSGRGIGFDPRPDWSVYVLFQIWENEACATQFMKDSEFFNTYKDKSEESATVFLRNIASHGKWDKQNPFKQNNHEEDAELPRLILTRATIKKSKLIKFWNYVPATKDAIAKAEGLIYTKGVGEWPITQMATISVWRSEQEMMAFAYGSEEHKKAIEMTRALNWYNEELFARFVPYKTVGHFSELQELEEKLKH